MPASAPPLPSGASGASGEGQQVSSVARLRKLPDVFTLSMLASVAGITRKHATVMASRWHEAGLARPAGQRSGVCYNLLRRPEVTLEMRGAACQLLYPSAVLIGESVLHNAGWTTQIPAVIHVAVLARRSYVTLEGVEISGRPRDWFKKVHPSILAAYKAGFSTCGLRSLPPALALADLYAGGGDASGDDASGEDVWRPDEHDLDIEPSEAAGLVDAFATMETDMPEFVRDLAEGSTDAVSLTL